MPDVSPSPSRQQEEDEPDGGDTAVRVKYDARLHGARVAGRKEPLTTAFLQKYIQYAKNRYKCAHSSVLRLRLHPCGAQVLRVETFSRETWQKLAMLPAGICRSDQRLTEAS